MKTCSTCKCEKEITDFYKDRGKKDGRQTQCKVCVLKRRDEFIKFGKRVVTPSEARRCNVCKLDLNKSEFYQSRNSKAFEKLAYTCKSCTAKSAKEWAKKNPEKQKAMARRAYVKHKAKRNAESRAYRLANPKKLREYINHWRRKNPDSTRASNAVYMERQREARTAWANTFFIKEAYRLARLRTRLTGINWEVDHIVPIRHPLVCGLHVEQNLQVIEQFQNRSKGNKSWPDMP